VLAGDYFCLNGSEIVSSDPTVVTVVTGNLLRAVKNGKTTVSVKNGTTTSTVEVTVVNADTSFLNTDYRTVKKADLAKAIENERSYFIDRYTEYVAVTDRTDVRVGDKVSIDFVGKKDGVAFEGGTGSHDLIIGSHSFIEGFEEGLVGEQVGTTVDLHLTFPDPYPNNPDLAGQPVIFTVTIKGITAAEEYNDAFIQKFTNGEYKTVEAFEEYLRKTVISDTLFDALTAALPDNSIPQEIKQQYYDSYLQQMIEYFNSMGMKVFSKKDIISLMGYTEEAFDKLMAENVNGVMRQDYVFYGYCQANNITLSEEVFNECLELYLARYGCKSLEELIKNYNVTYDSLYETFLYEEVSRALCGEVVII
jgi:trigger factor